MRRVLALTGIRSEYFLSRALFQAIAAHPDLELELVVSGAHLSPLHGETVRAIEADGFHIVDRIESLLESDRDAGRLKGAALQLQILAHIVDARRPDWLLAIADREEPMLLALCGAYLNLPVAHYSAGDRVVGNVDDMVRHSISRLAHLLLTTHASARKRLIQAGEQPWRVHNVGHAGIDRLRVTPSLSPEELARALNGPAVETPYVMVVQHPLSSEISQAGAQMRETLAAVQALGLPAFVSYPNSDAGGRAMIRVIHEYERPARLRVFKNIPDTAFVNLLRGASLLIGNSSLGLLEAPYLHLGVINVGRRQTAREHAANVCFVPPDRHAILRQAQLMLHDPDTRARIRKCQNPFGDGHAGERVATLLAETPIDERLLNKDLTY